MMFKCVLVLAFAVFGASAMVSHGYGAAGFNGMHGIYGGYGTTVADTCRCVKTVVRPQIAVPAVRSYVGTGVGSVVERIPYTVSRRVDAPGYGAGVYSGNLGGAYGGAGYGLGFGNTIY